jgi:hypothetical protein
LKKNYSEFKEPPIPLFQKTERLVVFMKELAVRTMGFWAVLSLFSYIFRMMIITKWIRISFLILWEQQL